MNPRRIHKNLICEPFFKINLVSPSKFNLFLVLMHDRIGNKFPSNHITPSWCDNEVFKDTSCTTLETPFTCLVTFLCSLTSFRRPFYRYYLVQNNFSWVFFKNLNMYIQERLATYFTLYLCFEKPANRESFHQMEFEFWRRIALFP